MFRLIEAPPNCDVVKCGLRDYHSRARKKSEEFMHATYFLQPKVIGK